MRNASFASARWGALRGVGNDLVGPRLSREVPGETQTVAQSNERERLVLAKPTFVASLCALEAGAVFHVRSRLLQVPRLNLNEFLLGVLRLEMNFLFEALVAFSKGQVRGLKFCMLERLAACPAKRKCASYVYVKALSRVQVRIASFASARAGVL